MPTPARTSIEAIVDAAIAILERDGLAALTMQAVAADVGVRAPSLYKRVSGRDDLLRLVAERVALELGVELERAGATAAADDGGALGTEASARARIVVLLRAARSYAHERPESYSLLFARVPEGARPDQAALGRSAEVLIRTTSAIVGPEHALDAARLLTAWMHGFVSMELAGAFRLGPEIDAAFEYGAVRLADALG